MSSGVTKPLAQALFWISCLLSVVSFYTTREGMALYLSPWFSFLAALGIQSALVIVAWLFGAAQPQERRRYGLAAVYVMTALVSVAFSYVSLNTWFAERERPVAMQRALYDELNAVAARTEPLLADAVANGRRYTAALDEMASAEKLHGHISRARDTDPYLNAIREAVAGEAKTTGETYREGTGAGLRYTAFTRHAELTRQATASVDSAWQAVTRAKSDLKPGMATDAQLRQFRVAYDAVPWLQVEQLLNRKNLDRPALPAYSQFTENSGSGQEDMMRSFSELFASPSPRSVFSAALAAFIDVIVFLLAFAAGPYLHGEPEQRWYAAGAALDREDPQSFARGLLRKVRPGPGGVAQLDAAELSPGEQQLCLLFGSHNLALLQQDDDGRTIYLLEPETHRRLTEMISSPSNRFRNAAAAAAKA